MNFRSVFYIIGWMLNIEGAFLLMPFMVGRIYQEQAAASFIIVAGICFAIGTLLVLQKPKRTTFFFT